MACTINERVYTCILSYVHMSYDGHVICIDQQPTSESQSKQQATASLVPATGEQPSTQPTGHLLGIYNVQCEILCKQTHMYMYMYNVYVHMCTCVCTCMYIHVH